MAEPPSREEAGPLLRFLPIFLFFLPALSFQFETRDDSMLNVLEASTDQSA